MSEIKRYQIIIDQTINVLLAEEDNPEEVGRKTEAAIERWIREPLVEKEEMNDEVVSEADKNSFYVIVNVEYDHYRFQENLAAARTVESARKWVANSSYASLPVYDYEDPYKGIVALDLANEGKEHVWIEKFNIEEISDE